METNQKQKRIFQIVTIAFVLLMLFFTFDFFSRTTLPGRKGQLKERIQKRLEGDTLQTDSIKQ